MSGLLLLIKKKIGIHLILQLEKNIFQSRSVQLGSDFLCNLKRNASQLKIRRMVNKLALREMKTLASKFSLFKWLVYQLSLV